MTAGGQLTLFRYSTRTSLAQKQAECAAERIGSTTDEVARLVR
jgi:hypothetical protein